MKKIKTISKDFLIQSYKNSFHIDIQKYFPKDLNEIHLMEDLRSGLLYYDPPITGDSDFYEQLEKFDWYYMDWKWEYEKALRIIQPGEKVLEIGSGKGAFLKILKERGITAEGIEFNQKQLAECKKRDLNVSDSSVEDLIKMEKKFDVVVSFQVMEHIPKVEDVLIDSYSLLNPKGKLIVSVPNGESFAKYDPNDVLNMPPHHVVIFTKKYFKYLNTKLKSSELKIIYEPLQNYHYAWFTSIVRNHYKFMKKYFHLVIIKIMGYSLFRGHTFLGIFHKK